MKSEAAVSSSSGSSSGDNNNNNNNNKKGSRSSVVTASTATKGTKQVNKMMMKRRSWTDLLREVGSQEDTTKAHHCRLGVDEADRVPVGATAGHPVGATRSPIA
jgi:hypothetical protein